MRYTAGDTAQQTIFFSAVETYPISPSEQSKIDSKIEMKLHSNLKNKLLIMDNIKIYKE